MGMAYLSHCLHFSKHNSPIALKRASQLESELRAAGEPSL